MKINSGIQNEVPQVILTDHKDGVCEQITNERTIKKEIGPKERWKKAIRKVIFMNKFANLNKELKVEKSLFGRSSNQKVKKNDNVIRCVFIYIYIYIFLQIIHVMFIYIGNSPKWCVQDDLEHNNGYCIGVHCHLCPCPLGLP